MGRPDGKGVCRRHVLIQHPSGSVMTENSPGKIGPDMLPSTAPIAPPPKASKFTSLYARTMNRRGTRTLVFAQGGSLLTHLAIS
jgi:hypothetical protein